MRRLILLTMVVAMAATACGDSGEATTTTGPGAEVRGPVFIGDVDILLMESFPVQVALLVTGELPTPCHRAEFEVGELQADGTIEAILFSLSDPGEVCTAVVEPFEARIPVGSYTAGDYVVLLNGVEYPFTI